MTEPQFNYGGQAVIEGVMMRGRSSLAIATRQHLGEVETVQWEIQTPEGRLSFLKWPLIRGTVNLVDSLTLGVKTLVYSANQALTEDEEEEESLSGIQIAVTVAISLSLSVGLFILLPALIAQLVKQWVPGHGLQNVVEGLIRVGIFVLYMIAVSLVKDVQRVFQYHGAEHKTIMAYEAGHPLTVENVQGMSRLHPRCGTSFLVLVMLISILLYSFLPPLTLWQRLASRLILLPLIAGIAYECIRLAGKNLDNPFVAILSWPGMQLQHLTTREPDEGQLEVAIAALSRVLQDDGLMELPLRDEIEDEDICLSD